MAKNILIFSDGTGQAGGLLPDEKRTNVYKLYRATRCGPDTANDPLQQVAFYDPGLGTQTAPGGRPVSIWRKIYNMLSQATGLGITRNIIDCYAAIIQLWQPGDRIYLFGFSRGAYTVRCLGGVLSLCGVPRTENGEAVRVDAASAERIASEAVTKVYQHGASQKDKRFRDQRDDLARAFRLKYGSDVDNKSNEVPYFIGVWDTVAALGASWDKIILAALGITPVLLLLLYLIAWCASFIVGSPSAWFTALVVIATIAVAGGYLWTHVKWAFGTRDPVWKTFHIVGWRLKFYDRALNNRVQFARHALSIDERRKDFKRVTWSNAEGVDTKAGHATNWFEQIWFAGNHADIGGGYIENESRLSDIALDWIATEAQMVPHPILVDPAYLRLTPSPAGMQHDETRRPIGGISFMQWETEDRDVPDGAYLHASVYDRQALAAVQQFDVFKAYDPAPLKAEKRVFHRYEPRRKPSAQQP